MTDDIVRALERIASILEDIAGFVGELAGYVPTAQADISKGAEEGRPA